MRHSVTLEDIYRPQRSCGKAMFLQLSVILSTGEGDVSQHTLGRHLPVQRVIAVDGTHPTGMHSCTTYFSNRLFCVN